MSEAVTKTQASTEDRSLVRRPEAELVAELASPESWGRAYQDMTTRAAELLRHPPAPKRGDPAAEPSEVASIRPN
jgi:hypothetical protein